MENVILWARHKWSLDEFNKDEPEGRNLFIFLPPLVFLCSVVAEISSVSDSQSRPSAAQLSLNWHKYLLLYNQPIISAMSQDETRARSIHWSDLRILLPHGEPHPHASFRDPAGQSEALIHWEYEMWELWLFNIIPPAWRSWWSRLSRTFRVIFYNCPLCIRNHRLPEKLCSVCGTSVSLFHSCFTFN